MRLTETTRKDLGHKVPVNSETELLVRRLEVRVAGVRVLQREEVDVFMDELVVQLQELLVQHLADLVVPNRIHLDQAPVVLDHHHHDFENDLLQNPLNKSPNAYIRKLEEEALKLLETGPRLRHRHRQAFLRLPRYQHLKLLLLFLVQPLMLAMLERVIRLPQR